MGIYIACHTIECRLVSHFIWYAINNYVKAIHVHIREEPGYEAIDVAQPPTACVYFGQHQLACNNS